MTEFETKRTFLFGYINAMHETRRLADECERIKAELTQTTQILSDMPRGGQLPDIADGIQRVIDAEKKLNAQLLKAMEVKEAVYKAILAVPDARQRLILKWRFINNKRLHELPPLVNYSLPHIKRLYSQGVLAVELPEDETS